MKKTDTAPLVSTKTGSDYSSCHTGNLLVFKHEGVSVYGGGANRKGGWHALLPDKTYCEVAVGPKGLVPMSYGPPGWAATREIPAVFGLDWADFGVPKVEPSFWKALVKDLQKKKIKSILCTCAGGHGRTGTSLSLLYGLMVGTEGFDTAFDLVKHIRSIYCEKAVEATGQLEYIALTLGIEPGKLPVAPPVVYSGFDGLGNWPPSGSKYKPSQWTMKQRIQGLRDRAAAMGLVFKDFNETKGSDVYEVVDSEGAVEGFMTLADTEDYLEDLEKQLDLFATAAEEKPRAPVTVEEIQDLAKDKGFSFLLNGGESNFPYSLRRQSTVVSFVALRSAYDYLIGLVDNQSEGGASLPK